LLTVDFYSDSGTVHDNIFVEEFVKLRFYLTFVIIFVSVAVAGIQAQAVDTVLAQATSSAVDSFAGGISGNGRFVVFESRGNIATENPRNADGNVEIFLWDYAQRRIFQITDTKNLLFNPNGANTPDNTRVEIINTRPVISNDGKWIAFSSNATIAFPGDATHPPIASATNPGMFDANAFTAPTPTPTPTPSPSPTPTATPTPAANSLTNDGNLEVWLYRIPAYADVADLSAGDEVRFANLAPFNADGSATTGIFTQVTNTFPSLLPRAGSASRNPFVANDNHDPSISDDGQALAFVSSRDLVAGGNAFPNNDNDEIFTYVQNTGLRQITKTPRGSVGDPIYSKYPTIGSLPGGYRVAFASTGNDPVINGTSTANLDCGDNASINEEIFYADLSAVGVPSACKQITTTTPTNPGDVVNILDPGRRMSRDGRYIAFDSYADLANENSGTNQTSFALYVYDTTLTTNAFTRVGPRSTADAAATGGDIAHYPGFTDNDANGTPVTLVMETRENIKPDGTIPTTDSDGLNPDTARPVQIYSYPLNVPASTATFKRLTKLPISQVFLASTQPFPSNTHKRLAFNLSLTEPGTGNSDLGTEVFYLITPDATQTSNVAVSFATGASHLAVSATPTPTPSPTVTPTPTPTPTPSPSVTPTPVTPSSVVGLSPGILAVASFATPQAITPRTAVGSLTRRPTLPIELSGVTVTINGVASGLRSVSPQSIEFVVPPALTSLADGTTTYPMVININGTVIKTTMTIVPARPDVFTLTGAGPGGRAKIFNITNAVPRVEPFTVFTIMLRGGKRVPSRMRIYLTGVEAAAPVNISIRIGSVTINGAGITTGATLLEPGVYAVDFTLPSTLNGAGDQPVVVTITTGTTSFSSRLDDTAPRVFIL
jgi:uncharacterized protein (TIGR03437 family)